MADGQLTNGMQVVGSVEASSNGITVCSWDIPEDTSARVEVTCLLQKTTGAVNTSYKLATNVYNLDGYATLVGDIIKYNEEGSTSGFEVTLDVNNNSIYATTTSTDGDTYRVVCLMDVYSVEQTIVV